MNTAQNGKGSKPRPYNIKTWGEEFDRIFGPKNKEKENESYDKRQHESGNETTGSRTSIG